MAETKPHAEAMCRLWSVAPAEPSPGVTPAQAPGVGVKKPPDDPNHLPVTPGHRHRGAETRYPPLPSTFPSHRIRA